MTRTQTLIINLIAQLPLDERRELFERIEAAGLLEETFYDRLTTEQRGQLDDGIAKPTAAKLSMARRYSAVWRNSSGSDGHEGSPVGACRG